MRMLDDVAERVATLDAVVLLGIADQQQPRVMLLRDQRETFELLSRKQSGLIDVLRPSRTRRTVAASSRRIERSVISPFPRITSGCASSARRNGRQSANSG